jgi:hypothetical protein
MILSKEIGSSIVPVKSEALCEPIVKRKLKNRVERILLEHGALTGMEILEVMPWKWTPTQNQLSNTLAKNNCFKKIGHKRIKGFVSGSYEVCVWAHVNDRTLNLINEEE